METKNRQKTLIIIIGVIIGLFVLDSVLVKPLTASWEDRQARIEKLKQEVKDPKPGARNRQLAVEVSLTVFGTTIPDAKLAFSGDGQSGSEAEVSEKRLAADTADTTHDVIKDAIKQAVDQAVVKLSSTSSGPPGKHRRK